MTSSSELTAQAARTGARSPVRRLLIPGLTTALMLAILVGLGVWQVERLAWKTNLLADIDRAERSAAIPLSGTPPQFAKIRVTGRFLPNLDATYGATVRQTPRGEVLGASLIAPLAVPNGPPLLVDRGWVPTSPRVEVATPTGDVTIEGFLRQPEHAGLFSAPDSPRDRAFYTLDPAPIGRALGLASVAPYTLVAIGTPRPGVYPQPAEHLPRPPNDHLSYAITWFGLAATLLVIFGFYARKVLRS